MAQVQIGSKLPHGILLDCPSGKRIRVRGLNTSAIVGAPYATTEADGEEWAAWLAENKGAPMVVSGALFSARNLNELAAVFRGESDGRKTGFERLPNKPAEDKLEAFTAD